MAGHRKITLKQIVERDSRITMKISIKIIKRIGCLIVASLPLFVTLDYYNVMSYIGFDFSNLNFAFWGLYVAILAGAIGGLLTLTGVVATIDENRKEQREEAIRLVKPMLELACAEYDYRWDYIQFDFNFTNESWGRERKDIADTAQVTIEISNVGARELLELWICNISSTYFYDGGYQHKMTPILYSGNGYKVNLSLYEKGKYDDDVLEEKFHTLISPIEFECYFKDCLENWYCQKLRLSLIHQIKRNTPIEKKALSVSVDRTIVDSSPFRVEENMLPWKRSESKIMYH